MSKCLADADFERYQAQELSPGERARVEQHLSECPECKRRQTAMLRRHDWVVQAIRELPREDAETFSVAGAAEHGGSNAATVESPPPIAPPPFLGLPPDSFPGYKLVREIHRGGQGVVYQAIQKATKRKVALKIMREGPFAGHADRARFEREIEVLGQLDHPHIVAIHDSGQAGGHFYLVMDYITGQPLDAWMTSGERTIADVLRLMQKISEAVNAAHLRGVIHRDLKPGNIRVDANGEPHILDFGLAKVAHGAEDASLMTMTGQFMGSLPWASPEQAEAEPSKIDIRTDVYSLGVILYQMLTGKFPYEVSGNMREALDRIVKAEPVRPSAIRRQIDDEIETIVLKCLCKERERRYQTAGELARDIGHYLRREPIEAKRDSTLYVLRKTLRRYRTATTVAAGFIILITGSAVALAVMYGNQSRERQRAEDGWRLAEQRAEETRQVADFQAKMLSDIDVEAMGQGVKKRFREEVEADIRRQPVGEWPNRRERTAEEIEAELAAFDSRAGSVQAVDVARRVMDEYVLGRAADALEEEFQGQPLVQAQIHQALGTTYRALGLYEPSVSHLRSALELRRRVLGGRHELLAGSLDNLAVSLHAEGRDDLAEPLYREALALKRELLGEDDVSVADTLNNLASSLKAGRGYEAAEPLFREALALYRKRLGEEHPSIASCLDNLGSLARGKRDFAAAEPLFREALAMRRKLLGAEHRDVATSLNNLAGLLHAKGDLAAAEPLFCEALSLKRRLLGTDHADVAAALNNLAALRRDQGDFAAAEPLYREALSILQKRLRRGHMNIEFPRRGLAFCLIKLQRYADAEPLLLEAYQNLADNPAPAAAPLRKAVVTNLVELCEAWHQAEPEAGHDSKAAEWRSKLAEPSAAGP